MNSIPVQPSIFTRISTLRSNQKLVNGVDWAGKWSAPILDVLILILAAFIAPAFYNPENLKTVGIQIAILGVVAIGQTVALLVRSIDLSVGMVMALGAVIVVQTQEGASIPLALVEAFLTAAAIGLVIGLLVTKRQVPPFVATFGMMVFIQGARLAYSHGQASGTVPELLRSISINPIGNVVPAALFVWLLANLVVLFVLKLTPFGRWIYAVGGNPAAARYAGINIDAVVIGAHIVCSMFALLGGVMLSGYIGYLDLGLGADYNTNAIAAVVVGGTTFTGGRGNLYGTAAGVVLLILLLNLVVVLGLPINWQLAMQGSVLVAATALQGFRQFLLNR